ncbi:cupin domain-containing protein [Streptomyces sp. NPDC059063]|uniref:cupin domain-containing protein n=1 Tax=unclassified Streptomyces TaxID=2593676 RepID=UPI0036B9A56C
MSYPDPRYFGDEGEINAVYRPAGTPPDHTTPAQDYHYLATTLSTQGEFGLYKIDMGPRAGGPSTHFHRGISESFYILSGELELYNGEKWFTGGPGDFLYVPVGGLHAFKNVSDEPMSMLMLFSPGAPREAYFENVAEAARRGGEEFGQFLVEHDSFFVDQ